MMFVDYYEDQQGVVVSSGENYEWFFKNYHLPFQKAHMVEAVYRTVAIPKDHRDLRLKEDFLKNTFDFDTIIGNSISRMTKLLEMNTEITEEIRQELANR